MNGRTLTASMLTEYDRWLRREERSDATREKYLRSVRAFAGWLGGAEVTKEAVTEWKAQLAAQRRAPSTVNTALAALNGLFRFLGWEDCRAKFLKVQRRIFRAAERELTRAEYDRLLTAAQSAGDTRFALLMESICATGIRVSEVKYLTVEAAQCGRAEVALKGKIRTALSVRCGHFQLLTICQQFICALFFQPLLEFGPVVARSTSGLLTCQNRNDIGN